MLHPGMCQCVVFSSNLLAISILLLVGSMPINVLIFVFWIENVIKHFALLGVKQKPSLQIIPNGRDGKLIICRQCCN
jgi:hypothetical protein